MRKQKQVEITTHHDIFYPSSSDKIAKMIEECEKDYKSEEKTDSKVFIIPHASYEFILPLLVNIFTSIKNDFNKILIIAPSHLKQIDLESKINIFSPSYDSINTPLGELDLDTSNINNHFTEEMKIDTYFEEESSFEQLYIMIQHYFSNLPVTPICAVIDNAKQSKDFSSILNTMVDEKALIFISANATSYQKANSAFKKAEEFVKALRAGDKLLQLQQKNILDSCGCGIIDSILKTKLYKNFSWKIKLIERENEISKNLIMPNTTNKCVYHISAEIKEN